MVRLIVLPHGACDTHMHVYDHRFPTDSRAVLHPPDAGLTDYARLQADLGLERVVVVQPTTYGLDNRCQLEAVASLGDAARAVVVVDENTATSELRELDAAGARGARFHMLPGGVVGWDALDDVAEQIEPLGWHIQLQLDGNRLPQHLDQLRSLPVAVVIDHVGRFMPPCQPNDPAFRALLELIDTGRCWVKLSAPYESTRAGAPAYPAVGRLVAALVEHAPERLLWASNWPHPGQSDPIDAAALRDLLGAWLPTDDLRRRVLVEHPVDVYGFTATPRQEHS